MEVIHPSLRELYCRVKSPGIPWLPSCPSWILGQANAFPMRLPATGTLQTPGPGTRRHLEAVC